MIFPSRIKYAVFVFAAVGWNLVFPKLASAYIGPGAGFAVVTSLFLVISSIFLMIFGVLLWPLKAIVRKYKNRGLKKISKYALNKKKVLVLGIDGLEISLLKKFIKQGRLPHFKQLKDSGTLACLSTTFPPESPVAWSSFLCGCNPGRHNIFDFLTRDPESYLPNLSMADVQASSLTAPVGKYRIPLTSPKISGHRKTKPFWVQLGERGIRSVALRVPSTFPPDPYPGVSLSAMGLPDLLGSQGTSFFYTTQAKKDDDATFGGQVIRVERQGNKISSFLRGPQNSLLKKPVPSKIPFMIQIDPEGQTAVLKLKDHPEVILKLKEFTSWIDLTFPLSIGVKVHGICKIYLQKISPHVELYVSPINIDPENPALPVSHPPLYSKLLAKAVGKFSTLGLAEDTGALNSERIDEEAFLQFSYSILEEREKIFFYELDRFKKGCLINVFDTVDRIQHMFWQFTDPVHPKFDPGKANRYGEVIAKAYEHMDGLLEKVFDRIDDDTSLYIMSDHGFRSFRHGMNVNTWLKKEGYLKLKEGQEKSGKYFQEVDWTKTQAYSVGLSGIFINQKGRERQGIVNAGADTESIKQSIVDKILTYRDTKSGKRPVVTANPAAKLYNGEYLKNAPDIVLGFRPGFRVSWKTALGEVSKELMEDNLANWSGDHCLDPKFVPGTLLTNRKLSSNRAHIMDLAPTILEEFELEIPAEMDGAPLQ